MWRSFEYHPRLKWTRKKRQIGRHDQEDTPLQIKHMPMFNPPSINIRRQEPLHDFCVDIMMDYQGESVYSPRSTRRTDATVMNERKSPPKSLSPDTSIPSQRPSVFHNAVSSDLPTLFKRGSGVWNLRWGPGSDWCLWNDSMGEGQGIQLQQDFSG